MKKIILVFKTHFDIGFTDLAANVIKNYSHQMLDRVLETCESTEHMGEKRYVWTMPSWPLKIMLENCSADRKSRLERLIYNEQIVWHALPFTSHFDFCGLEDYRYGFTYAEQLSRMYGKPFPISAKMTDVPGHGCMLPSLLARQGVKFLHLGSNEFIRPPKVPDLFYWEAPDGKRVLTMYSKGYGSGMTPPENWPYSVWLALMHTHDNSGPQSAEMIREMTENLQTKYPGAEIVCGTMDQFYTELAKEDLSGVPVIHKDLADTWIHGVGSYPREVKSVRQTRRKLSVLRKILEENKAEMRTDERLRAEQLMAEAYGSLTLFGEHTWGLDVKTWLDPNRAYEQREFLKQKSGVQGQRMEASWREQAERAELARKACGSLSDILGADFRRKKRAWTQEEIIRQTESCILENEYYRLELNPNTGEADGLYDKKKGCCILKGRKGKPALYYQYDRYGIEDMTKYLRKMAYRFSDWGIRDNGKDNYPECGHIKRRPRLIGRKIEGDCVEFLYENDIDGETYGNASRVLIQLCLKAEHVKIVLKLENKSASPYTESGSLVLNLPMEHAGYTINKNGCVLNPETDIIDWGNHALYCLENFVTAHEAEKTICAVSADAPLLGLGETGIYKFRKRYKKKKAALYFNLFNNMWGTNFPQWIEGDFSYRFLLFETSGKQGDELREEAEKRLLSMEQAD